MTLNLSATRADPSNGPVCSWHKRHRFPEGYRTLAAEAEAMGLCRAGDEANIPITGPGSGLQPKGSGRIAFVPGRERVDPGTIALVGNLTPLLNDAELDALLDLIHAERRSRYLASLKGERQ